MPNARPMNAFTSFRPHGRVRAHERAIDAAGASGRSRWRVAADQDLRNARYRSGHVPAAGQIRGAEAREITPRQHRGRIGGGRGGRTDVDEVALRRDGDGVKLDEAAVVRRGRQIAVVEENGAGHRDRPRPAQPWSRAHAPTRLGDISVGDAPARDLVNIAFNGHLRPGNRGRLVGVPRVGSGRAVPLLESGQLPGPLHLRERYHVPAFAVRRRPGDGGAWR